MEDKFSNDIGGLIAARIQRLRPKLLDLSRRNPLLATKFSDRSNSHIRVIDELPDIIFQNISSNEMQFKPLPLLEDNPEDEEGDDFQALLPEARFSNQTYLDSVHKIDQNAEDSADLLCRKKWIWQ
ncbi:MAG: DUF4011 domain-containing protein [Candidatus Riflebacteria bacterium]|nr:DUF4011 domain-containing protein [Candidatus Riflebacteria bacterium]